MFGVESRAPGPTIAELSRSASFLPEWYYNTNDITTGKRHRLGYEVDPALSEDHKLHPGSSQSATRYAKVLFLKSPLSICRCSAMAPPARLWPSGSLATEKRLLVVTPVMRVSAMDDFQRTFLLVSQSSKLADFRLAMDKCIRAFTHAFSFYAMAMLSLIVGPDA